MNLFIQATMSPNKTRLSLERKIDGGTLGADVWVKARTECILKTLDSVKVLILDGVTLDIVLCQP